MLLFIDKYDFVFDEWVCQQYEQQVALKNP